MVWLPDDIPASSRLASNLNGTRRVWISWNAGLKPVRLQASLYEPNSATGHVDHFYAGGVDSSYILIFHLDDIDLLPLVLGFDHTLSEGQMAASVDRNDRFARQMIKPRWRSSGSDSLSSLSRFFTRLP